MRIVSELRAVPTVCIARRAWIPRAVCSTTLALSVAVMKKKQARSDSNRVRNLA
jgi:hypothetical protein